MLILTVIFTTTVPVPGPPQTGRVTWVLRKRRRVGKDFTSPYHRQTIRKKGIGSSSANAIRLLHAKHGVHTGKDGTGVSSA
jgi:hypothetical protein